MSTESKLFPKRPWFLPCRTCLILVGVLAVFGTPIAFFIGYASMLHKDSNYLFSGLFAILGAVGVLAYLSSAYLHLANHFRHSSNTHPAPWLCACSKQDALAKLLACFSEATDDDDGKLYWAPEKDDYFVERDGDVLITAKRKYEPPSGHSSALKPKVIEIKFRALLSDSNGEGSPCKIACTYASTPGIGYAQMDEAQREFLRTLGSKP